VLFGDCGRSSTMEAERGPSLIIDQPDGALPRRIARGAAGERPAAARFRISTAYKALLVWERGLIGFGSESGPPNLPVVFKQTITSMCDARHVMILGWRWSTTRHHPNRGESCAFDGGGQWRETFLGHWRMATRGSWRIRQQFPIRQRSAAGPGESACDRNASA